MDQFVKRVRNVEMLLDKPNWEGECSRFALSTRRDSHQMEISRTQFLGKDRAIKPIWAKAKDYCPAESLTVGKLDWISFGREW